MLPFTHLNCLLLLQFPSLGLGKVPVAWSGKSLSSSSHYHPAQACGCSPLSLSFAPQLYLHLHVTLANADSTFKWGPLKDQSWIDINPNIYPPSQESILFSSLPFSQYPLPNKTLLLQHPVWCSVHNTPVLPNRLRELLPVQNCLEGT